MPLFRNAGPKATSAAHPSPRRAGLGFGLALAACLAAGAATSSEASAQVYTGPFVGSVAQFYTMPTTAAAAPGTLIRYQPYTDKNGAVVAKTYRVMYWSTMTRISAGVTSTYALPVTGVVYLPSTSTPTGGFPTLVFEHGTLGVIPECGPSRASMTWQTWMLGTTFKTVAPDFPGLGLDVPTLRSSDKDFKSIHPWYLGLVYQRPFDQTSHPFVSMSGEGRSSIDIVRAAQDLEYMLADSASKTRGAGKNPEFVAVGQSQGGQAALATGEMMAAGYAPELELLAVAAGAPASTYEDTTSLHPALVNAFFGITLVGGSLEIFDLQPSKVLTTIGQANYERTSEQTCSDLLWQVQNATYTYQLVPKQNEINKVPGYETFVRANSPGNRPINVPVFVGQVDNDVLIYPSRSDRMVNKLRTTQGAEVTYCKYAGNGATDVILGFANHGATTPRMWDGKGERCTLPNGTQVTDGSITVRKFFNEAGFPL
jgi:pimeloyl-ACP methyl ester carboxylesterase